MYIRDKRSPSPKSETVSRVMSANRAKNTSPEIQLRKAIWQMGFRGYRLHRPVRTASVRGPRRSISERGAGSDRGSPFVRPDISFVGKKLAIFVMGCFWHRCPKCNYKLPKHNRNFWKEKFDRNIARDEQKKKDLRRLGWKVIFVWECDLKESPTRVFSRIQKALHK